MKAIHYTALGTRPKLVEIDKPANLCLNGMISPGLGTHGAMAEYMVVDHPHPALAATLGRPNPNQTGSPKTGSEGEPCPPRVNR